MRPDADGSAGNRAGRSRLPAASALAVCLAVSLALSAGCAASRAPEIDDAVQDFIAVAGLAEHEKIRTRGGFRYDALGERYVIVTTLKHQYLMQFTRRCRELYETAITPDIRREANVLRARYDTLRGCRIGRIYEVDEAQAAELLAIGERPGEAP